MDDGDLVGLFGWRKALSAQSGGKWARFG